MLIQEAKPDSGPKELRVKIGVEYHLKLHALKLLRGKRMSEAVEEALEFYFERVRLEQEAAGSPHSFDEVALAATLSDGA